MKRSHTFIVSALAAIALPVGAATISNAHCTGATANPAPHGTPSREITQPRSPAPPPSDLAPRAPSHDAEPPGELVKAREHEQGGGGQHGADQPAPESP